MHTHMDKSSAALLGCLCAVALFVACSGDAPTAPSEAASNPDLVAADRVSVCHRTGTSGTIIAVSPGAVGSHLKHGDYLTTLFVSHASSQPNDDAHFHRIGDALAAARAGRLDRKELRSAACRITIAVAAGSYPGITAEAAGQAVEHYPLNVDVPDLTFQGAFVMGLDAGGRATGLGTTGRKTTLEVPPDEFVSTIFLANGRPGGSAGHGLVVEGFTLKGFAAYGVFSIRVHGLVIRGNRFEGVFDVTLDLRATSAVIEQNEIRNTALCDMCLAGPGRYRVTGNRLLTGASEGILTVPAMDPVFGSPVEVEPSFIPAASEVSAEITNNEVRDHRRFPGSAGVRMAGIGIGTENVKGSTHVQVHDNLLVNNLFGVMVEAGFPAPDTKLRSDMDVVLGGNTIERSCQADLYVTFERHSGVPEPGDVYFKNTTYRLTLNGDVRFSDAWVSNPGGLGNTLIVDGRKIGHGTYQPFDEQTCPARR